jgi:probable rRNA maturation factor
MNELCVRNRQRCIPVNLRLLRKIAKAAFEQAALDNPATQVSLHLVSAREMARLNWKHLRHEGSTDVITFDYGSPEEKNGQHPMDGEIVVCPEEAVAQAAKFKTSWQSELVRYLVHGLLHLQGYDDHTPSDRKHMKREENRLLRALARRFPLQHLERKLEPR